MDNDTEISTCDRCGGRLTRTGNIWPHDNGLLLCDGRPADPWAGHPETDKIDAQDTDAPTWFTALDAANLRIQLTRQHGKAAPRAAKLPTDNDDETADRVTYAESTCPLCDHTLTRWGACPNEPYAWHL